MWRKEIQHAFITGISVCYINCQLMYAVANKKSGVNICNIKQLADISPYNTVCDFTTGAV